MSGSSRRGLLFLLLFYPLTLLAAPADDMKLLLENGKAAEAYALAKQSSRLGNHFTGGSDSFGTVVFMRKLFRQ